MAAYVMKLKLGSEGKGSWCSVLSRIIKINHPNIEIEWKNDQDCDIVVRSLFDWVEKDWLKFPKPAIYFSGESDPRRIKFRKNDPCRLFLDTTTIKGPYSMYVPFLLYKRFKLVLNGNRFVHTGKSKYKVGYCNTNPVKQRDDMFDKLVEKIGFGENKVVSFGNCCGTHPEAKIKKLEGSDGSNELIEMYKKCDFVFAMENCIEEGYISEKLGNAFYSGAIPIYWGASIVKEFFNSDSYINVSDFDSLEEVADYISNLSDEKIRWMKQQRIFKTEIPHEILRLDSSIYGNSNYYKNIADKIDELMLNDIIKNKVKELGL